MRNEAHAVRLQAFEACVVAEADAGLNAADALFYYRIMARPPFVMLRAKGQSTFHHLESGHLRKGHCRATLHLTSCGGKRLRRTQG